MNLTPSNKLMFRQPLGSRLLMFCICAFLALIVVSFILALLGCDGEVTARRLRLLTMVQDILLFIFPPVATAVIVTRQPAELLTIDRGFSLYTLLKVVLLYIAMVPLMNLLVEWNSSLNLPESFAGIESWMRQTEAAATAQTDLMLAGSSVGVLIINLLIVAVLAGVSEELFFRAGLQRLLTTGGVNIHLSVWLTAAIFSAFHVQFFGFFPRLLLGALFGYLLTLSGSVWLSASAHVLNNAIVVVTIWLHNVRNAEAAEAAASVSEIPTPDIINPTGSTWGYVISAMLTFVFLLAIFKPHENKNKTIQ